MAKSKSTDGDGNSSEKQKEANENSQSGDDVKVVLEQTLLKSDEVFVYRIPPMMTSGGHRAEDWNLAKPLATCSLHVIRTDNTLCIKLFTERPKANGPKGSTELSLFAQCTIHMLLHSPPRKMEHWVESVVDSSRYFVIRISDEKSGREAHVGMGFRERNEAVDFKMSLQDYENALRKEKKAEAMHVAYETLGGEEEKGKVSASDALGNLTLKEGEKIHINLKGQRKSLTSSSAKGSVGIESVVGKGGLLLKKPPPPASGGMQTVITGVDSIMIKDRLLAVNDESSTAAVGGVDGEDEDEWGDFESSTG